MNDLIRREDAIKATWQEPTYADPLNILTEVRDRIEAIPSADRPQKWIPLCRYLDDGSENPWWSYIDDCCAWNNVVLAWMPLPEPYREESEVGK